VSWQTSVVYPHDGLASEGRAVFTDTWVRDHGQPPSTVALGRADLGKKMVILRTQVATGTCQDVAVTTSCFNALANPGETVGVDIRFKQAGFWCRIRHRPGAILELAVAVVSLLGAVTLAAMTFVSGVLKPGFFVWPAIVVLVVASLVAASKFVLDAKKAGQ
jgi:hypothetical protein